MLGKFNLKVVETGDDGNCLFEAVADQILGNMKLHKRLRKETVQYMAENKELYENYMEHDCNINDYIGFMAEDGTSGG